MKNEDQIKLRVSELANVDQHLAPPPPVPPGLISHSMSRYGKFVTEWYRNQRLGLPYSFEQFGLEEKFEELNADLAERLESQFQLSELPMPVGTDLQESPRKTRGRKTKFSRQVLARARQMKTAKLTNNEIAKVLYDVPVPTADQRRSVPTILKYHESKKQVEE